ncbi:inner centromere protein [Phyllosticta citriasiana]|uniref:inner centromere protein n=1 Tax=Phyllosticta citriasiana TaxID=595635 RepID=UPI0030FD78F7
MRSQAASRQANDLATQLQHEKSKTLQSHPRGDMAGARPVSRMNTVQDFSLNRPVNPAKPAKRVFQPDEEETVSRPQVQRNPPTFQRLDAKRRKTDEDEETTDARRSMMAPPIRQSNVRKLYPERERIMSVIDKAKDGPNKYSQGYMSAASGSHTQASSMLKQTPATFKTPMGKPATTTVKTASPHFPTPELPEIATDSEDEDSDSEAAGFRAPSWVNSPALRDLLTQQQLVDPMEVFGPIAPLQMEEIFKYKERHKRFRERTSSANWSGNDRLTEDERKKDREARERMMKDGGWTYELFAVLSVRLFFFCVVASGFGKKLTAFAGV